MSRPDPTTGVLDLRTYRLIPGGAAEFDRIFRERALPMLERFGIEVVGYGPSLEDGDLYYLMRAFPSATVRERQLDAFYGSNEWRDYHRDAVLALIETHHTVVLELAQTVEPASGWPWPSASGEKPGAGWGTLLSTRRRKRRKHE